MGKTRSAARKLDPARVHLAKRVELAKHELAMKMVAERVKTDAEFAEAVLKLAGEGLREEIKKDALETIAKHNGAIIEQLKPTGETIDGVPVLDTPENKDAEETISREALKDNMKQAGGVGNAIGLATMENEGKIPEVLKDSISEAKSVPVSEHTGSFVVDGDRTHELVPEQTDGGETILVEPTSKLDFPKDGDKN